MTRAGHSAALLLPVAAGYLLATLGGAAAPCAAAASTASPRPFLWRVERHGQTSHLFGTIHLGIDPEAALGPLGLAALDGATRVFVEMDITSSDTVFEFTLAAMRRAQMPPDRSLRTLLRQDAWDRLVALHKGRVPAAELERLEPWFVGLWTLPLVLEPRRKPNPAIQRGAPPLDGAITERASARGAKVSPLESPVEHLAVFSAIGRVEGVAMLEELVADPEAMRDEADRLLAAYTQGDERALRKYVGRLQRRRATVAEYLLFRRNERWRDRLELWFPDGEVFVAVGAAHMYGERGLVALLRQRGYRVARVPAFELVGPPRARGK